MSGVEPVDANERTVRRAPFRAWLVTGPVGRLVGFLIDFARALRAHLAARRRG